MNLCRTFSHWSLNITKRIRPRAKNLSHLEPTKEKTRAWEFKCLRYLLRILFSSWRIPVLRLSHQPCPPVPNTSSPEPRDSWTKHSGQSQDCSASRMPLSTPNHSPFPCAGTSLLDTWPGVLSSKGSSNSWGNWNRVKNKLWQWPWQLFSPQPARAPHANVTSLSTILKIRMWEAEINALPASATQRLPAISRSAPHTQTRTANALAWSPDAGWKPPWDNN